MTSDLTPEIEREAFLHPAVIVRAWKCGWSEWEISILLVLMRLSSSQVVVVAQEPRKRVLEDGRGHGGLLPMSKGCP